MNAVQISVVSLIAVISQLTHAVLFRIYELRSGDAEFGVPGREKPVSDVNNSLSRIPADE